MATYAEFDYDGYPSGSQISLSNTNALKHTDDFQTAQTRISLVSTSPQSSVGDKRTDSVIALEAPSAALSPDDLSQASNSAGGPKSVTNIPSITDGLAMGHVPGSGTTCCENGEPIITDLVSGERVCPCHYDPARLALSSYTRLPASSVSVYGPSYPPTDHNPYQSIGMDSAVFYSPLSNPYALKDSSAGSEMTWTSVGLQATTGYYPYDHMGSYGYGSNYDLTARRKNTTRESTATLKAWLNEHKKNPYPTKGEKIMLAIITKMTLTQISTWFANARRRLKKENKMTWEPKNRNDDDDDVRESDDGKDKEETGTLKAGLIANPSTADTISATPDHGRDTLNERLKTDQGKHEYNLSDGNHRLGPLSSGRRPSHMAMDYDESNVIGIGGIHSYYYRPQYHGAHYQHQHRRANCPPSSHSEEDLNAPKIQMSHNCDVSIPTNKSKIWSLADTIACKTPPPVTVMSPQQQQFHQMSPARIEVSTYMGTAAVRKPQHSLQQPNTTPGFIPDAFDPAPSSAFGHFLGVPSQQLQHFANTAPYHDSNFNDSKTTSSQHSMIQLHQEQLARKQQQQYQHHQQQSLLQNANTSSQQMGFPGAQPDTPPQTPPNMKIHNASAKLVLIASQTHTTPTCRTTNKACSSPENGATYFSECSTRDDSSSQSSDSSEGNANVIAAVYEPFFNRLVYIDNE